jgi:hypothetical protein
MNESPLWMLIQLIDSIEFALQPPAIGPQNLNDAWFRSKAWKDAEKRADDDLRAGRYEDFETIDEVMAVLLQNAATDHPDQLDKIAEALRRGKAR